MKTKRITTTTVERDRGSPSIFLAEQHIESMITINHIIVHLVAFTEEILNGKLHLLCSALTFS